MIGAGTSIRMARQTTGLTQEQLGERMGISQPAVARMENAGDKITVETFRRAIWALDRPLMLIVGEPQSPNVDDTLVASMLRMTPERRLDTFEAGYAEIRELALAAEQSRGAA